MHIDELIKTLQEAREKHGNIIVFTNAEWEWEDKNIVEVVDWAYKGLYEVCLSILPERSDYPED
jgi:pyruvate-formate lyase-activating enzyme